MSSVTCVTTPTYEARAVGAVVLPMHSLEELDDAALGAHEREEPLG